MIGAPCLPAERSHETKPRVQPGPRILGTASVFPQDAYSQHEVEKRLGLVHPVVKKFLRASHIEKRHLILPPSGKKGTIEEETAAELDQKFAEHAVPLAAQTLEKTVRQAGLNLSQVGMVCCVTSTGFLVPGLSSRVIAEVGLSGNTQKLDIVGMGCNAAVSALNPVVAWTRQNPGRYGVVICCEINSASYALSGGIADGLVNSLFGDAVVGTVLQAPQNGASVRRGPANPTPCFVDFESLILPEHLDAMRFDFLPEKGKRSFFLSRDIPFVVGRNAHRPVVELLTRHGLDPKAIEHWIIHTGGAAVIDGVKHSLGLSEYDVRHTRSVLRDFGNVSSGSVLLSLERLMAEGAPKPGDLGVMLAMGPGASLDAALLKWS